MIRLYETFDLLKSGLIDTALLYELEVHPDFVKLLADIQIHAEGIAAKQIQNLNAWVDMARAEIMEKYQPGEHDKTAGILQADRGRKKMADPDCPKIRTGKKLCAAAGK